MAQSKLYSTHRRDGARGKEKRTEMPRYSFTYTFERRENNRRNQRFSWSAKKEPTHMSNNENVAITKNNHNKSGDHIHIGVMFIMRVNDI